MKRNDAIKQAVALLKDEANELAMLSMDDAWKKLPHRAKCGVQRELTRLRDIADVLSSMLPKEKGAAA